VYALMYEAPRVPRAEAVREVAALLPAEAASPSAPSAEPPPSPGTSAATARARVAAPSGPSSSSTPAVEAEALLIQQAQGELAKHNIPAALAALDEHARKFPHGTMAPAREALRAKIVAAPATSSTPRDRFGSDEQ
jgi:hypothetical protein